MRVALLISLISLSGLLWGAVRSFHDAVGMKSFARLSDHDYLADIEILRQGGKLAEALALSQFVCDQQTYPQRPQACRLAQQLYVQTRTFWYRARSMGRGVLTGAAANGWALVGATTADFLVVGDVRDLLVQSWRMSRGQEVDELLMGLSAVGLLTVTMPALDWVPSFSKIAVRLGALSTRFTGQLTQLSRRAVTTRTLTPLHGLFRNIRRLVLRLGPVKALGVLPVVENTEELAIVARLAAKHPRHVYGLLKVGGHDALNILAKAGPEATTDMLRAARKGAPGLRVLHRFGRRMFTSHLLIGAGKALHRGRLPQAMSLWLAAQTLPIRVSITAILAGAWLFTCITLWRGWRGGGQPTSAQELLP
jgi:hypothetical protein